MARKKGETATQRRSISWRNALKIVTTNGGLDAICCYCCHALDLDTAEVDHIVPISRGGTNDLDNLEIVCRECNRAKGTRELTNGLIDFLRFGEGA